MRVLFSILFVIALIALFPLVIAAVFLLFQADVNHTRLFTFGIVAVFIAVYNGMRHFTTDIGRPALWAVLWIAVAGGLFGASYNLAPKGVTTVADGAFQSLHEGSGGYPQWHPANLVAEQDQVRFALALSRWIGRDYDDDRGATARRTMKGIYEDLNYHAEELVDYGSQLHRVYNAGLGKPVPGRHRYVYRSLKGKQKSKMPVILLLHGSEGNLKAGLWALTPLADDVGMAIVAPSHSGGGWDDENATDEIRETLTFCRKQRDLDESAVVLVGYGSGGVGVNRAARTMADQFRGFVHIGAEFTPESTIGLAASKPLETIPLLVMHGADDRIFPVADTEKAVGDLKRWKIPVTYQRFEEDGAMLLFKRSKDISNRIATWMRNWRS